MKRWHQVSSLITSMGFNCIIIPYSHNKTVLSASLNKTFLSFVNAVSLSALALAAMVYWLSHQP